MYVGIDYGDPVYDTQEAEDSITSLFCRDGLACSIHFQKFTAGYRGKICWIWAELAARSAKMRDDFQVLLGDDIVLQTPGWKPHIENSFRSMAVQNNMPFGVGCVAFRDTAFSMFPTFPVIHRSHFDIFGQLFPRDFVNQSGDPFLFEIYRRYGVSQFSEASLTNTIGGAGDARYAKHDTCSPWRDLTLTEAVRTLAEWLSKTYPANHFTKYTCLDIVCPSFRCDVGSLKRIADLRASTGSVSTQVIIVLDDPSSTLIPEVQSLQSWEANHVVRVYVNSENIGAGPSRNTGMAQCFADFVVCLDDDVVPESTLLDAYIGAIARHPDAQAWVGVTRLAPPHLLMEHALCASRMTFFYDVAARMDNPPWGVTANICFRARTQNSIWFSDCYPKSGGGEDVDYCLRLKGGARHGRGAIVAVPGAVVHHPFWEHILSQVAGWAVGDVLCLQTLPHSTFYTVPNWAECVLLLAGVRMVCCSSWLGIFADAAVVVCTEALMTLPTLREVHRTQQLAYSTRWAVYGLALAPGFVQDLVRLRYKVLSLNLYLLCMRFDWMDGQGSHVSISKFGEFYKLMVRCLLLRLLWLHTESIRDAQYTIICCVTVALLLFWWLAQKHDEFTYAPHRGAASAAPAQRLEPHPTPFVILTHQRTGSNLLCGILHNHPDIVMHSELFHDQEIMTYHGARTDIDWEALSQARSDDAIGFLYKDIYSETAFQIHRGRGKAEQDLQAVGFKLFHDHGHPLLREAVLSDPRIKKVVLHRRGRLDVLVSMIRAAATGKYLKQTLDEVPVRLTPAELQGFADSYDEVYDRYDTLLSGQSVHRISYEDLVWDRENTVRSLLDFLDVENKHVPGCLDETVKQTQQPLRDTVCNYDELAFAFRYVPNTNHHTGCGLEAY